MEVGMMMHGYFRVLCVGYALYAVGNTVMLILLYFTDYSGVDRTTSRSPRVHWQDE